MATLEQILDILSELQAAYPYFNPPNPRSTLNLYIAHLGRFSQPVLVQAARQVMDELKFFPSVAELVRAARHAEATRPSGLKEDRLAARRQALEDACWLDGHFDPAEWEALAVEMQTCNREFSASAVREKARKIAQMAVDAEGISNLS
jgi:hypothetical protein